jgi:hypothetical protein
MKSLTYNRKGIKHEPIKYWELSDGNIVAMYQGSRGANPDLDFIVKYLAPGKRLRMPSHTHWIVDLLIKADYNSEIVKEFINEWKVFYEELVPFKDKTERDNYKLRYNRYFSEKFKYYLMGHHGDFSVEFLSTLLELFIRCEKQTPNAFMFKNLLNLIGEYCDGKKDFYQVVSLSKRV